MKMVPINAENIDFIRLDLSRHYIQIDCDFVCYIVLNPSGTIPVGGTDVCAFHVGAWQVDAWKFLTKDFAQIPGFSACLVWDKTLVTELSKAPQVAESDIDTANSISSLKGQPVNITGFSLADGESLKVSTTDDEWINIKPYKSFYDDSATMFSIYRFWKKFKVGDVLNIDMLSNCGFSVSNVEGGYRVEAPIMKTSESGTVSDVDSILAYVNRGRAEIIFHNTTLSREYYVKGLSFKFNVDFILNSENVITSINIDISVIGVQSNNEGYNGARPITYAYSCESVYLGI